MGDLLPVHGFVLAGGRSTRMGEDKALKNFLNVPMVELAVEKLRGFCTEVGIVGNRDDLGSYAAVVHEARLDIGPAAGIEAGLMAATQSWVLFLPVDVPLVPMALLEGWARRGVGEGCGSYLVAGEEPQPAFCLLRREDLAGWSLGLDRGGRRLMALLGGVGAVGVEAEAFAPDAPVRVWFSNVNTLEDLAAAESLAGGLVSEKERNLGLGVHHRGKHYE